MNIEEWVQQNRKEKRELFGEVGLHDDCKNYDIVNGVQFCKVCNYWDDGYKHNRNQQILECEKNMCYFYDPKRKENVND